MRLLSTHEPALGTIWPDWIRKFNLLLIKDFSLCNTFHIYTANYLDHNNCTDHKDLIPLVEQITLDYH